LVTEVNLIVSGYPDLESKKDMGSTNTDLSIGGGGQRGRKF